jgi:hypothetical protein
MDNQTKGPWTSSHEPPTDTATPPPRWNPGVVTQFPWLCFTGFFGVLACAAAVSLVLIYSDGQVVDDWGKTIKVSPNVLAVIFTTLANILLAGVVTQGIVIAWWRRALGATTIRDLQRYWDHGDNILSCLTAGRPFSVIALATLSTKLVILDSALVRRATTVEPGSVARPIEVTSRLATEYPPDIYYSSPMVGRPWAEYPTAFTEEFRSVIGAYQSLDSAPINPSAFNPMRAIFEGCRSGTCVSAVEGIGFAVNCSTTSESIDYGKFFWTEPTVANPDNVDVRYRQLFSVTYDSAAPILDLRPDSIVRKMSIQYTQAVREDVFSCPGTLYNKTCDLRPAVVRYPMVVSQDNAGILMGDITAPSSGRAALNEPSKQIDGDSFVRYLFEFPREDRDASDRAIYKTLNAIGGVSLFLKTTLSGNATLHRGGEGERTLRHIPIRTSGRDLSLHSQAADGCQGGLQLYNPRPN